MTILILSIGYLRAWDAQTTIRRMRRFQHPSNGGLSVPSTQNANRQDQNAHGRRSTTMEVNMLTVWPATLESCNCWKIAASQLPLHVLSLL